MKQAETRSLSQLGYALFLDRYAMKDIRRETLKPGDLVLICPEPQKSPKKEIGTFGRRLENGLLEVWIEGADGDRVRFEVLPDALDLPLETDPDQMWDRVAVGVGETPEQRAEFYELLHDWKFVPGGRILASAGTGQNLTGSNCYVLPFPRDSRSGIFTTLDEMAELMSRGGGVGINLSSLRPRYAYVKGVNGRSSGGVSWGSLYAFVTGLIEQGGSRRGALMLVMAAWHPDVLEFINSKREAGKIVNANISVAVPDAFMEAVRSDGPWRLEFPETTDPRYDKEWCGDLAAWKAKGYPVRLYRELPAREVWRQIVEAAWASAEPGIWFVDRARRDSNSEFYKQGQILGLNPCAEQCLPGYGVCNLGHLNLAYGAREGWAVGGGRFAKVVHGAVRFLDRMIDVQTYFLPGNAEQQALERRVGLGTLGLAELLVRRGLRYGSDEAVEFTRDLYRFIALEAYAASHELAKQKGPFKAYAPEFWERPFAAKMKRLLVEERGLDPKDLSFYGVRNVCLLTQAPTGTVGTMVGTSTGIEPYYYYEWKRNTRLGTFEERMNVLDRWQGKAVPSPLPPEFVTALELSPEEHLRMQAAVQEWTDASISKTNNVPGDWTVEQVARLYESMYDLGCKGGTIYRDRSRDEQVLEAAVPAAAPQNGQNGAQKPAEAREPWRAPKGRATRLRPRRRRGETVSKDTGLGTCHVTGNVDEHGNPLEVFVDIGKGGSDLKAMTEGFGRLASLVLQLDSPVSPSDRVLLMHSQLAGIGGANEAGMGPNRVRSVPDALAQSMEELFLGGGTEAPKAAVEDLCPGCSQGGTLFRDSSCLSCRECGWSKC